MEKEKDKTGKGESEKESIEIDMENRLTPARKVAIVFISLDYLCELLKNHRISNIEIFDARMPIQLPDDAQILNILLDRDRMQLMVTFSSAII